MIPGPRLRCRWHLKVDADDLDHDPNGALRPGTAGMPPGSDVVLEVVGDLQYADGTRVALALHGARSIEVFARGPGVAFFMRTLEQGASIELEAAQ